MARIRTIKPEFWTDEKLSLLDPLTRLVFLGLMSMADDAGRLVDNVKLLDGMLFPSTDDSCLDALDTLARTGRVIRYTSASGQGLIQVANWTKHQRVDHPSSYVLPGPDDTGTLAKPSRDIPENDATPSRSDQRPTTPDLRAGVAGPEPSEYARTVTAAANRAAVQKWHSEPFPQGITQSFTLAEECLGAGVPLAAAVQRVVDQILGSNLQRPPRTIRYFLPGILEPNTHKPRKSRGGTGQRSHDNAIAALAEIPD